MSTTKFFSARNLNVLFSIIAVLTLAWGFLPDAGAQSNVLASSSSGVFKFTLGGPGDGSNQGSFISGAPPLSTGGAYRRLAYGADVTGDGTNDVYVSTESDSIRIFNGTSGAYNSFIAGTSGGLRQIATDPSNLDLYYCGFGVNRIGRRDASGASKPGTGQSGDTFVPATPSTFSVIVGPDLKVYIVNSGVLERYSTAGGVSEKSLGGFANTGALKFGPDVTGDGRPELYLSNFSSGLIGVEDVLSNPSSWTPLPNAVTGLNTPVGFAFQDNNMYIAENGANRIDRYRLVGTSWVASPSVGNSGATFASLTDVQDILIPIPESSTQVMFALSGTMLLLRRLRK